MKRLTDFVFRNRAPIIVVFLALTVFFAFWIKDLKVNSDSISYLPKDDAAVQLFNHLGDTFKQNDVVVAAVESDDVFSARTLQDVDCLTQAFQGVDGVSTVLSLADMMDIRKASDGAIEIGRLFEPGSPPTTPEQIQALRATVMSNERYRGGLVSNNGRTTLVVCQIRSGAKAGSLVERLKAAAAASGVEAKLYFGGNPMLAAELSSVIVHDLQILIPIVSVLIILTLYLAFGTIRGVLVPLGSVLMSTVWIMGFMALVKVPLTLVSNIIPALLVAIGSAPCIHILSKFDEDVSRYGSRGEESQGAFREVGIRVVLAALTIVLGFSSFIVGSYLTTIRDFGIFASVGVLFSLLISIIFVPAVLGSIKVSPRRSARSEGHLIQRLMAKWAGVVVRHRRVIIAVSALILVLGIAGIPLIRREAEFTTFLDQKNPVRVTEALLQREFGGSRPLDIDFTGDLANPFVLKEMLRFERFIAGEHLASNPLSLADLIAEMNDLIDNCKTVPDDRAKVSNLMFMLEGQDIVNGLVSDNKDEGQIQSMVGLLDSTRLKGMIGSLDAYIRSMNRELVEVKMASLSPEDRRQVMQYWTQRACEMLQWLIKKRAGSIEFDPSQMKEEVTSLYRDSWPVPDPRTALPRVLPLMPAELQGNKNFQSEVEGELADLSQLTTAVPVKLFRSLSVGSAAQAAPQLIRFNVQYTGMPLISWHLDQSVLWSQAESLVIAFVFIFLLLALKLGSWRGGIMGLAPIVLAVVLMFGLMGFTGIPINVATVLVGSIALGIGIDYSIHFSVRFSTYYRGPSTAAEAVAKTIQTTGLAIIINVLAVTMGFIALLFADLLPLRQFGILTAIAMIGSGAGALSLLPALMLSAPAAFMGSRWDRLPGATAEAGSTTQKREGETL
ncbi:MAG: MMPL family transporter [Spirochaetia bacterium]|jgi:predicted RND superfamily exporter protein